MKCSKNHYNSLFVASSHNFISPNFCVKYLKMPTMIPVQITQTQEENDNPTMAIPFLNPFLVAQIPERKLIQKTMSAENAPKPKFIQVATHKRGSTKVQGYKKYTAPVQSHGTKKKGKAIKSKKNTKQAKLIFSKAKPVCMASVQLAESLHIKYLKELVNSF